MDPLVVLFGLGVGVLVGMTGIGGGSLMTPLLILVCGTKPVVAIGTDLAYGAITKTVGGWRHLRKGTVDLRPVRRGWRWAACPARSSASACSSACTTATATAFDSALLIAVAAALVVVGAGDARPRPVHAAAGGTRARDAWR